MKSILSVFTFLFTLPVCLPVSAELMGMVPGRSAYLATEPNLSVDVGANWYTNQLQWVGSRINFKPSPRVVTYLDVSVLGATGLETDNSRLADFLGAGYGGGIMFAVPDFFVAYDVAFYATYHSSVIDEFEFDPTSSGTAGTSAVRQSLQQSQWSAAFLLSPLDPLFESGTSWYSSLGFVSTSARTKAEASSSASSVDYQQKNGVAFGLGIFKPIRNGRLFAGFEWLVDNPLVGVGASYSIR